MCLRWLPLLAALRLPALLHHRRCRGEVQQFANDVEVGTYSRLVWAAAFPIQKQGFHDLPAVWVLNRLQWCAASECGHLVAHPALSLLLNDLLEVAPGFGVMKKSLFEFVVLLRSRLWFGVSPKRASAFRFPLADIWPDLRSSLRRLRIGPKS